MHTYSPVSIFDIHFQDSDELDLSIPKVQIAMIYIIEGELRLKDTNTSAIKGQMVYFNQNNNDIDYVSPLCNFLLY